MQEKAGRTDAHGWLPTLGRVCRYASAAARAVVLLTLPTGLLAAPDESAARVAPFQLPASGKAPASTTATDFDPPTAMAFDSRNRPYLFDADAPEHFGYIMTLRGGTWEKLAFRDALEESSVGPLLQPTEPDKHALGSLAFDTSDALYALLYLPGAGAAGKVRRRGSPSVLLYSPDLGKTFQVYRVGAYAMETDSGHNDRSHPPALAVLELLRKTPNVKWGGYYRLSVLLPEKHGDRLTIPPAIPITDRCVGISNHSGGGSIAISLGKRVYVVYAEIGEDEKKGGNPTLVAAVDRESRQVVAKRRLCVAPPAVADCHSTPVIAADSEGRLHVVAGAHGQSFFYLHSLAPNDIESGWTEAAPMGPRQTYATLICDERDALHAIFRQWRPLPTLAYQNRPADTARWAAPQPLALSPPGHKGYGIFYHRLFRDRDDALYASFTFFEFTTGAAGQYPRLLVVSQDHGQTWHPATTEAFTKRVRRSSPERE